MASPQKRIEDLSFEEALKELEGIVRRLETGEASLEQAIGDYEAGMQLKSLCQKKLEEARLKVEKIVKDTSGQLTTEALGE